MHKGRIEAFSDGVIAIIITIMVLELKVPHDTSWTALADLLPIFLSYVMSFVYIAIYWNNHHHMFQASKHVDGRVLWANVHLLFWLSLVPFVTGWMGENHFEQKTVGLYGVVMLLAGVAYNILASNLVRLHGKESTLARAFGRDLKGKGSLALYAIAVAISCINNWIPLALYVVVAVVWLIPDRRIERHLTG